MALANRSACSFHLGSYELAIADVHHALALNYPRGKRLKVLSKVAAHLASISEPKDLLYF